MGFAREATSRPASSITSSLSFFPLRNSFAFSTRNGRDATAPSAIRVSPSARVAAAAQLPVTGWGIIDLYLGQNLVGPAFQVVDAVVVVEVLERDLALT